LAAAGGGWGRLAARGEGSGGGGLKPLLDQDTGLIGGGIGGQY
jgi:hypothetical protein